MPASLESYSFDPSLKPLQLDQEKRKWLPSSGGQMLVHGEGPDLRSGALFVPKLLAAEAGSRKAEVAAQRRQAFGKIQSRLTLYPCTN
ncbi:hypothetical protein [Bacillus sp. 2205SS5-2]|uniref:hypothetical protein n=1 Tax=Bacillus sp. 2205SS5-2 TaxID=3109031 RepID=UPI00300619F6